MRSASIPSPRRALTGCLLLVVCTLAAGSAFGEGLKKAGDPKKADQPGLDARAVVTHFIDGSVVKLTLADDKLTVVTASGKKAVRLAEIRKIEFAFRVPDEVAKKITAAIARLDSEQFEERERAVDELVAIGVRACPALAVVAKDGNAEVKTRAAGVLARLRATLPEELLEVRNEDVVHTTAGKIVGKIEGAGWKATTPLFGEVQVKLADVRFLRSQSFPETEDEKLVVQPDPGTLSGFKGEVGKLYAFNVTGVVGGIVWGSDVYTSDSTLATAAVHAGVLAAGKTGTVKVRLLAGQASYGSSTRNGVTTQPYGPWSGSFEFVK
jgi:hypothetical protein